MTLQAIPALHGYVIVETKSPKCEAFRRAVMENVWKVQVDQPRKTVLYENA